MRFSLNGTELSEVASLDGSVSGLSLDSAGQILYLLDGVSGSIWSCSFVSSSLSGMSYRLLCIIFEKQYSKQYHTSSEAQDSEKPNNKVGRPDLAYQRQIRLQISRVKNIGSVFE